MDEVERARMAAASTAHVLYSTIITISLLIAAFVAFPDKKIVFALSVIFIRQGMLGFIMNMQIAVNAVNAKASRENYQSLLLLREDNKMTWKTHDEFLVEVRRRVENDISVGDIDNMWEDPPFSKLQLIGMLSKNFARLIFLDLILVSIAFVLTSNL